MHHIKPGRPKKVTLGQTESLAKLRKAGKSFGELAKIFGISRSSAHQYFQEYDRSD